MFYNQRNNNSLLNTPTIMNPLEMQEILFWSTIIAIVALTVITGRMINRFLTYRAHRRALAELRRRALSSFPDKQSDYSPATVKADR